MQIELSHEEAETLRRLLQQKVEEMDKEINRTDALKFKEELNRMERTVERILGQLTAALEKEPGALTDGTDTRGAS
jgi:hypothetical protein